MGAMGKFVLVCVIGSHGNRMECNGQVWYASSCAHCFKKLECELGVSTRDHACLCVWALTPPF